METSIQGTEENPLSRGAREDNDRRMRWAWTESTIWTDSMLIALENGVKGGKWYSLKDKICKFKTLFCAWLKVQANKGAAGIDRVSIEKFDRHSCEYIKELEEALKNGTYKPAAVKRVYIPKGGGKMRPLGIPTVKDRIVQQAVKMAIEPILEKEFLPVSYGFRPGKGAKDALQTVSNLLAEGYTWVVDADIQSYFDTIPHALMMEKVERHISDGAVLSLINGWMKQDIAEECKTWTPIQGTPQGAVISPLLANLYLHDLDQALVNAGYQMVRYADDFVILTKTEKEALLALEIVRQWVEENGLTLHPEKTHVGNSLIEGQGFDFLGYRFEAGTRWVRKKSAQKFRDNIRAKTRRSCGQSIEYVIELLNPVLMGWSNYFKHVTKYTLGTFDGFVRRRLRAILLKNHKKKGIGLGSCNMSWSNAYFANLGLFTMGNLQDPCFVNQSR
jgi:RNA-directed DNA polymerase